MTNMTNMTNTANMTNTTIMTNTKDWRNAPPSAPPHVSHETYQHSCCQKQRALPPIAQLAPAHDQQQPQGRRRRQSMTYGGQQTQAPPLPQR